jgi:peptidoglycan/xylan/chitin deacetylase (PgdA/CDA1 family)
VRASGRPPDALLTATVAVFATTVVDADNRRDLERRRRDVAPIVVITRDTGDSIADGSANVADSRQVARGVRRRERLPARYRVEPKSGTGAAGAGRCRCGKSDSGHSGSVPKVVPVCRHSTLDAGVRARRWAIGAALCLCALVAAGAARAQRVALTFDDGPDMQDAVALSPAERNAAILAQLAQAGLRSILFVTRVDSDGARNALISQWGQDGHGVGNHTATHPDFNDPAVSLEAFERELLACDRAIHAMPGYTRRFRFPYLKEGETAAKRDGFRAFLASQEYATGPVSIDTSDWYYSARLRERIARSPTADRIPYRDAYLRHLLDRARYYDHLSRAVLGRSVSHVILLHHNLINALYLRDVIAMFRANGWTVVDAETAFGDPVYRLRPDVLPAGESVLWSLARAQGVPGLRSPGEDDVYEKPVLDRLDR